MRTLRKFLRDESGATAIEYAIIGSLMSILLITGALAIGSQLNNAFYNQIAGALK